MAVLLGIVVVIVLWVIWRVFSIYTSLFPRGCTIWEKELEDNYDYIIVGGGTAGCILANRLSENRGATVLLLEAGKPDDGIFFRLGILGATFMNTPYHWNLFTQPEPELELTDTKRRGRILIQCRAKCLGGCSSLNLTVWHRGHPKDYDTWRDKLGCKGWGFAELKPYFEKCEGKGKLRSTSGYFSVNVQRYMTNAGNAFVKACASVLNMPMWKNFLDAPSHGVGSPYKMVFSDGTRCNAVRAYLTRKGNDGIRVCDRPNLTIATEARVRRIALDNQLRARGVYFSKGKDMALFTRARREVILCAGTVHSPSILIQSGIGPPDIVSKFRECKVNLPGVGKNLRDVASSGVIYEQKESSIEKRVKTPISLAKFAVGLSSPLHSNTLDSFAFVSLDEKDKNNSQPNLMLSLQAMRFPFACIGSYTRTVSEGQSGVLPNAFTIHCTLLQPKSKGRIVATENMPGIYQNYLSDPSDMKAMIKAIKVARKVGSSPIFERIRGREMLPGPLVNTDEEIEEYLRRSSCHFFGTMVGTCKMGDEKDPLAVVDPLLRVRNTKNLRVVDASVMPTLLSGFTHATVAAMAERAADIIKGKVK